MLWVRRDPRILGLLQEPPRRHARWWESSRSFRKFDGSFAATDRLTYQLYQDTGMFGQRWWVIQGNTGGHRYLLNPTEKKLLGSKADGRFQDVPLAGDLPYAPFDQRVVQHLGEIEQVAIWQRVVQHAEANEARYDADEKFSAEVARSALADWLDRQYAATWDEFKPVYKQALRDMAPTGLSRANIVPADNAQWKEQFVASGT